MTCAPVDLQQSPVVQVVSDHEVRRTLALMRQPTNRPLTMLIGHDVCRRTNGFAVLGGALSLVGSEYVIGLEALECATDAYYGRVDRSRTWMRRAVAGALRNDFKGTAALWTALHAVREALLGNNEEAGAQARAAVALEENADTRALAAVALARAGDLDAARQLADRMRAERPPGTLVQSYWTPLIRAQAELHGGGAEAAIESLRAAEPYELSDTRLPLLPAYLRGEAYLQTKDGRRAAAEFRSSFSSMGRCATVCWARCRGLVWRPRWLWRMTGQERRRSTRHSSNSGATLMERFH